MPAQFARKSLGFRVRSEGVIGLGVLSLREICGGVSLVFLSFGHTSRLCWQDCTIGA